jgi:hypothetical protein
MVFVSSESFLLQGSSFEAVHSGCPRRERAARVDARAAVKFQSSSVRQTGGQQHGEKDKS